MMIEKQPLYISGMENEEHCKESALGALFLFIITLIGSLTFNWYDSRNKERWHEISQHDDHDLLPRGMSAYNFRTDSELELISPSQHESYHEDIIVEDETPSSRTNNQPDDLLDLPAIS